MFAAPCTQNNFNYLDLLSDDFAQPTENKRRKTLNKINKTKSNCKKNYNKRKTKENVEKLL